VDGDIKRAERAGQWVYGGTWVAATIAMAVNAGNAVVTFGSLGGNRAVGLGIGIVVDAALVVALIGDRQLARHAERSYWSWALQLYAMVMGLTIAVSAAVATKHYLLAGLLAGVTPLLWLLMGYGQDVFCKFARITDRLQVPASPDPQPAPAPAPVAAAEPVLVPWTNPVVINRPATNGHRDDDGWRFQVPDWARPTTPDPVPDADPDQGGAETGRTYLAPDPGPGPDSVDTPTPAPAPPPPAEDRAVLPSLTDIQQWRTEQKAAGKPYGRDAMRDRFGLQEREARALIAALRGAEPVGVNG
jgi:hypothetical protein